MPFEEIQHTADWSLRVWAADLPGLFAESARGMNALTGVRLAEAPRTQRTVEVTAPDAESLLVAFLSELVYFAEHERLAFEQFDVAIEDQKLMVRMSGAPILSLNKAIKAVTYHNLHIHQAERGYEVEIVFDV